ncbi:hypothetical protein Hanom_Chr13g01208401 [Helianthus anomalus]
MNEPMLTVVAEARVQHDSLKTNYVPLLKMTRMFPRVKLPKQYVLPEMATQPRLHRVIVVFELMERIRM